MMCSPPKSVNRKSTISVLGMTENNVMWQIYYDTHYETKYICVSPLHVVRLRRRFRSQSFLGMTGEKIGLVVITLERYFKIVHAIAHRKYYRDWMTKVGVALPWILGLCTFFIPAMLAPSDVKRKCPSFAFAISSDGRKVRTLVWLTLADFVAVYLFFNKSC